MTNFFKKSTKKKKTILGSFWALFAQILGKNEFSWIKGLCQFLDIPIIYHRTKNQKKLMRPFLTDGRTDGRTDNGILQDPPQDMGSIKIRRLTQRKYNHLCIDKKLSRGIKKTPQNNEEIHHKRRIQNYEFKTKYLTS